MQGMKAIPESDVELVRRCGFGPVVFYLPPEPLKPWKNVLQSMGCQFSFLMLVGDDRYGVVCISHIHTTNNRQGVSFSINGQLILNAHLVYYQQSS